MATARARRRKPLARRPRPPPDHQSGGTGWRPLPTSACGSVRRAARSRRCLHRHDRADLHRGVAGRGHDGGPPERLVQIGAFDDGVPAELLLDLRRGTVSEDRLAVSDPHRRRGGPARQRGAVDEHPRPDQRLQGGAVRLDRLVKLGRPRLRERVRRAVEQEHVLHGWYLRGSFCLLLITIERAPSRWTPSQELSWDSAVDPAQLEYRFDYLGMMTSWPHIRRRDGRPGCTRPAVTTSSPPPWAGCSRSSRPTTGCTESCAATRWR